MNRLILLSLLLMSTAFAQAVTDRPLTTFERPADNLEATTPALPVSAVRVARAEAFEKVFLTTETIIGSRARVLAFVDSAGTITTRTQIIYKIKVIATDKFITHLRPGYFVHPIDGKIYRNLATNPNP